MSCVNFEFYKQLIILLVWEQFQHIALQRSSRFAFFSRTSIAELPSHLAETVRFSINIGFRRANVTGSQWS